jgi:hypothetical protein
LKVEDIEIRSDGQLDRPYRIVSPIEARVTAGAAWNKARTVEDVNSKLREVALKMGANAVINVQYERGVSATSWKALTATGTAVFARSIDRKCPFCAESIKREARACRFCGRDVEPEPESTDFDNLREDYPAVYDAAIGNLESLATPPENPAAWVRELCQRIDAGSPPDRAASNIPLDWSG